MVINKLQDIMCRLNENVQQYKILSQLCLSLNNPMTKKLISATCTTKSVSWQ